MPLLTHRRGLIAGTLGLALASKQLRAEAAGSM